MKTRSLLLAAFALLPFAAAHAADIYATPPYPFYWDPASTNTTSTGGNGTWNTIVRTFYSEGNSTLGLAPQRVVPRSSPTTPGNLAYSGPENPTSGPDRYPYDYTFNNAGTVSLKFERLTTIGGVSGQSTYNYYRFNGDYTFLSTSTSSDGTTIGSSSAFGYVIIQVAPGKTFNLGGNLRHITLESASNNSSMPSIAFDGGGSINLRAYSHLRSTSTNGRVSIVGNTTVSFLRGSAYDNGLPNSSSLVQANRLAIDYGTVNVDGGNITAAGDARTYAAARGPGIYIGQDTSVTAPGTVATLNINSGTVRALSMPGNKSNGGFNYQHDQGVSLGAYNANSPGGTLNLNGGTLITTNINSYYSTSTKQTALINFNGGTLKISTELPVGPALSATEINNVRPNFQKRLDAFISSNQIRNDARSQVTISSGGAFIDTSLVETNNATLGAISDGIATISAPINGTGDLTKLGLNTLRLSATNTYSGNTTIEAGNLILGNSTLLAPTTQNTTLLTVQPSAKLIAATTSLKTVSLLGNSSIETIGNSTIATLNITPDATITLNISATPAASTPLAIATLNTTAIPVRVHVAGTTPAQLSAGKNLLTVSSPNLSSSDFVLTGLPNGTLWSFDSQTLAILPSTSTGSSPAITTQPPANPLAYTTTDYTLSANVSGSGPLSYQWFKNGAAITGNPSALTPTLILPNVQTTDAASYTLTVTNSAGSITSDPANLTVSDYYPPLFTKNLPTTLNLKPGSTIKLSATATAGGNSPIDYQWLKDNSPIPGATTNTLNIPDAQTTDTANYTLQATNQYGSSTTSAEVWVGDAPKITAKPQSQQAYDAQPLTLNVTATGDAPLSYQWLFNNKPLSDGELGITGATSPTLIIDVASPANANGTFTVKVSNPLGTTSASASVSVLLVPIFDQNVNAYYSAVTGQTFSMPTKIRSKLPVTFQWFNDATGDAISDGSTSGGSTIKGAKTAKLTFSKISETDAANYYLIATNDVGSFTSNIANLWVGERPKITQNLPVSIAPVPAGGSVTLNITATGGAPLQYLWHKNGAGITNTSNTAYSTHNTTLTVNSSGTYHVKIYNNVGTATSRKLKVTVIEPPIITKDLPANSAFATNSTLSLAFAAKSQTTPDYEWFYRPDGNSTLTPLSNNKTSLKLPKAQPAQSGLYSATATNIAGTSSTGETDTWVGTPPKITKQPKSLSVHVGDTASFNATTTGDDLEHVWFYDTYTTINAATINVTNTAPVKVLSGFDGVSTSNLSITDTTPAHAGKYALHVRNPLKTLKSSTLKLTVQLTPSSLSGKTLSLENTGDITFTTNTAFTATFGNSTLAGIYTNKNNNSTTATIDLIYSTYNPAAINTPLTLTYKTYAAGGTSTGTFKTKTLAGNFTLTTPPSPAPLAAQQQTDTTTGTSTHTADALLPTNGNSTILPLANALTILRSILSLPSQTQLTTLLFTFTPDDNTTATTFPITGTSTLAENEDGTLTLTETTGTSTYHLRPDGTSTHTNTETTATTNGTFTISQ